MNDLTRRGALVGGAGLVAGSSIAWAQRGKLTAGEVVDRIKKNLGIPWDYGTHRDNFKTGGPSSPVTGIATSFGGNLRVLQIAQKAGLNMVIVHEPTFYSDQDVPLRDDPLYKLKTEWMARNNIVVWRIHDHWHAHKPDGIATGWNKHIGWVPYQVNGSLRLWKLPPTTLAQLADYVAKMLPSRSIRIIGDPNLPVSLVGRGGHDLVGQMQTIQQVDCLFVSEAREYDSFEYVRDIVTLNPKKGALFVSHEAGEDWGMNEMAEWLRPLTPEVPVKYVPTTDEFWTV